MCQKNEICNMERIIDDATKHLYHGRHPMNRLSQETRDRIEEHLDLALRSDPGASDGVNICRLYNPDVNTYTKLCDLLRKEMCIEDEDDGGSMVTTSTMT